MSSSVITAPVSESPAQKSFPENLPPGWRALLASEKDKDYFKKLTSFLNTEYRAGKHVYPERAKVLRALQESDIDDVRVVILGQDPYHGPGQAVGLSFAVPNDLKPKPPSLQNIFKEIEADLKVSMTARGSDLSGWVKHGVLLLNTVLTVRAGEALSHREKGWELFTDRVIACLNERETPIVFLLWGASAHKKKALLTNPNHFILESVHPSPLSAHRGFFGCRHFSKANAILKDRIGTATIDWSQTSLS